MKKFFLFAFALLFSMQMNGQFTPATNAVALTDSLRFVGSSINHSGSVVYHPVHNKYYSLRMGNASFPLETWNVTGGLSISQDTAGVDTRGMWYNPNNGQVERNCFNTIGWATMQPNASGNATINFSMLFAGLRQPTAQSVAAYDFKTNKVLFYQSTGKIKIYDRNTGNLTDSLLLTGTPFINVNSETVIYTGQTGFEIGLLDFSAKRVLLFNRATGVLSGSVQLPANAATHAQFRFSYSNNRVWLFNATTRTWNSFHIWNEPLPLPIELLSFSAKALNDKVGCQWSTASETNNDYFTVERSRDGINFEPVGTLPGAGNSTSARHYAYTDEKPYEGVSYFRLKQTDYDGRFSYSGMVSVEIKETANFDVYPNPAREVIHVNSGTEGEMVTLQIIDGTGKLVYNAGQVRSDGGNMDLDVSGLNRGIYYLQMTAGGRVQQSRIVLN